MSRYFYSPTGSMKFAPIARDVGIALAAIIAFLLCWPFKVIPTGSRGVLTQFGAIKSIEQLRGIDKEPVKTCDDGGGEKSERAAIGGKELSPISEREAKDIAIGLTVLGGFLACAVCLVNGIRESNKQRNNKDR